MEVKAPLGDWENPFAPSLSLPFVVARLTGAALLIGAVISGVPALEWMSVPVLLWVLLVVWGRHVLFAENLNSLPHLRANASPQNVPLPLPTVSLIVPARNEEVGIESAVRALAAIDYPGLEILIIDDHSSDATPRILQRLACEFPHLRVLAAPEVPDGWTGKTHACWFGFLQSNPGSRWLLFTDARVIFSRNAVSRAVSHAEATRSGFLSCILRFDGENLAEELIAIIQNRGLVSKARAFGDAPIAPFVVGPFMLIRRDVYAACGGHSLFPSHPREDFMLARSAHRCGATPSAAIASELLSIRRYHGFADMRQRMVRGLRLSASDGVVDLLNRISLELVLGVLPLPLAIGGLLRLGVTRGLQPALAVISLLAFLAYLAGTCTPRNCRGICRFRSWVVWLHPLGAALWMWLLLLAITERLRGQPISWRGRTIYAPTPAAPASRSSVVGGDGLK
jgi:hypothetical protein